jgi:hypothetical protein
VKLEKAVVRLRRKEEVTTEERERVIRREDSQNRKKSYLQPGRFHPMLSRGLAC